jgi:thiamine kinase-like enzyme
VSALSVSDCLARVPLFQVPAGGLPPVVEALPGGLTNRNLKVTVGASSYVARISSPHGEFLSIDRDAEHANSRAAALAGVAPLVVDRVLPSDGEPGVMVIEWIDGRTWSVADVGAPRNLARIAQACRQLHAGPRFTNDFSMFAIQRRYLKLVLERGFRLPRRYLDFLPQVAQLESAMALDPPPTVPCHNDLLAENFIDDGERLWLIDYEYAGNNDPYFELGNIASEAALDPSLLAELVAHYDGHQSAANVARARLWGLMSQYGWTLWASIQVGVSELDFDFWEWGMEKYDRAVAMFDSHEFAQLLGNLSQAGQNDHLVKGISRA